MLPVMNHTKWEEMRSAMLLLGDLSPLWRTRCITNGYVSQFDGEWYYHFNIGGFKDIEWVEIKIESMEQRRLVLSALKEIHVPGTESEHGFKVFGCVPEGSYVDYL